MSDRSASRRTFAIRVCCLLVLCGVPSAVCAQAALTISVDASKALVDQAGACEYTTLSKLGSTGRDTIPAARRDEDVVSVVVFAGSDHAKQIAAGIPLEARVGHEVVGTVPSDAPSKSFYVGKAGLAERVVTVWRPNATVPLCSIEPFPLQPDFTASTPFTTHTDIVATGEVSDALRTGTAGQGATGSFGFHHVSFPEPGTPVSWFPSHMSVWGIPLGFRMSGEDLRALISVANTTDSVMGPTGGDFARSVLLPAMGGTNSFKTLNLEYFPFHEYGRRHQYLGPDFRLTLAQSLWAPPRDDKTRFPATSALLAAFDLRLRWVAINRVSATDGNSFSFSLDGGYIRRSVGGDVTLSMNDTLYRAALGTWRTVFNGYVFGARYTLRQVTAYADFQCLSCQPFRKATIEYLEGWQPVIGFRFDAPLFTIGP